MRDSVVIVHRPENHYAWVAIAAFLSSAGINAAKAPASGAAAKLAQASKPLTGACVINPGACLDFV